MCGINGIFGIESIADPESVVEKMNDALAHRGPDAAGIYRNDQLVLGHRRLSVIDPHPEGNQPFFSPEKDLALVFNGEIYNYRELKKELTDYTFRTNSDTEVILAAWRKWGRDCVAHLDGMFAFALWDTRKGELFIARDRMGVKPLYYYRTDNALLFSSEIRALLASGYVGKAIDRDALVDYLRYQTVHAPKTIVKGVFMLMPGHFMVIQDHDMVVHEYWNAASHVSHQSEGKSYREVKDDVRHLLDESVKKRLVSDVPFGAFLSGGIDSTAVVALMSNNSDQPVSTFTVSFDEEEFSEARYAKKVAEKFGTRHTEITITAQEFLSVVPRAIEEMDHPSGDGPNTWMVSRATKNAGITMALSGIGGDELFAGYDVFRRLKGLSSKQYLQYFPMMLRKSGGSMLRMIRPGVRSDKLDEFLRLEYYDLEHVYPLSRQVLKDELVAKICKGIRLPVRSVQGILESGTGSATPGVNLHELSKISYAEMYSYLQNVLLRDTDQMSMAHALEIREPFLDHQLLSYVMGVRDSYKFPDRPKKLLLDAMGDLIPEEIWNRPKMGFTFPWKNWMKNELRSYCAEGIEILSRHELIDEKALQSIWRAFLHEDPRYPWGRVWHLVVLGHWIKKNLSGQ